jgi:hypothetical protein
VDMGPAEGGATTGVLASTRGRCGRSKRATAGLLIFGGGVTARGGSSGFPNRRLSASWRAVAVIVVGAALGGAERGWLLSGRATVGAPVKRSAQGSAVGVGDASRNGVVSAFKKACLMAVLESPGNT